MLQKDSMTSDRLPEVREMRAKMIELSDMIKRYGDDEYGLIEDDFFEYLIIARAEAMSGKIQDMLNYTTEVYRQLSDKNVTMKQILSFFQGKTSKEKKEELRKFIKEHPEFRTTCPELLLQRLRLTKKYGDLFAQRDIPQQPIRDAIKETNGPIPSLTVEEPFE